MRPNGCKKPYNPILGEKFFCFWDLNDKEGSRTEFVGEQVSHHPPISGLHIENRKHNICLNAHVHAKGTHEQTTLHFESFHYMALHAIHSDPSRSMNC